MSKTKFSKLSSGLQKLIVPDLRKTNGTLSDNINGSKHPVSAFAERTLNHTNGGATLQAALWLKDHLDNGGKIMVTLAGALSSFQIGVMLADLIRKGKVHIVSATGANHEESYYRYVAPLALRQHSTLYRTHARTGSRVARQRAAPHYRYLSTPKTRACASWNRTCSKCGKTPRRKVSGTSLTNISGGCSARSSLNQTLRPIRTIVGLTPRTRKTCP